MVEIQPDLILATRIHRAEVIPELEKIIALRPDLILAKGTLQKTLVTELETRGQKAFWIYPRTVNDVLDSFERIGKLTGCFTACSTVEKEDGRKN